MDLYNETNLEGIIPLNKALDNVPMLPSLEKLHVYIEC